MKHKLKYLFGLSFSDKLLLVEIASLLAFTRIVILFLPFKKIAPKLGEKMKQAEKNNNLDEVLTKKISLFIPKMSRFLPWECKCFVQAYTGKIILNRKKIKSTIYFGVCKEDKKMLAHAWLSVNNEIILGAKEAEKFNTVSYFS